ncbi:MAG: hypothetical protein J3Q66DRAFT_443498 [Benniella sp.]|nr:MAG: hypothetical protein J3Q66DRAFT_443498 [Benniella sp.]
MTLPYVCDNLSSSDLVLVLLPCINLHTFETTDIYFEDTSCCSQFDASVFIDMDSGTGSLEPWKCEGSIRNLTTTIITIPRPDLTGDHVIMEAGQEGRSKAEYMIGLRDRPICSRCGWEMQCCHIPGKAEAAAFNFHKQCPKTLPKILRVEHMKHSGWYNERIQDFPDVRRVFSTATPGTLPKDSQRKGTHCQCSWRNGMHHLIVLLSLIATMLDIPELDQMVYRRLSPTTWSSVHELARGGGLSWLLKSGATSLGYRLSVYQHKMHLINGPSSTRWS